MASTLPVAIVTGTNSGLGLSLAVMLAVTHKVYAGMRGVSESKRAALDAAVAKAGVTSNVSVIDLDVNNDESVNAAISKAVEESGRCDILVNNAGYSVFGSIEMIPMDKMTEQLNTNVLGVIRCTKAVLPTMRKQKSGKIINISSIGGVWGQPFNDIYCASKFALEGLAEAQAPLFQTFGVSVTNVQPGGIITEFVTNAQKPDPSAMPAEYLPGIQSTMAAYAAGGTSMSQTADEVAISIMDQVVKVDNPPVKVQTNAKIQDWFELKSNDNTGNAGRDAAVARFLSPPGTEAPKKAAITLTYWPIVGRALAPVLLLEDSGVTYARSNYTGGKLPHGSVVCVPCIETNSGEFVSQTMAIMETLGDELGYLPPAKAHNKALQCMYNIYDIVDQVLKKRMTEIKTKTEAATFVNSRVAQFFVAIESGFKTYPGKFYYGDETPCIVDFQLLAVILGMKVMLGDELIDAMLIKVAPTARASASAVADRPRIKAYVDSNYKGLPFFMPTMKVQAALLTE